MPFVLILLYSDISCWWTLMISDHQQRADGEEGQMKAGFRSKIDGNAHMRVNNNLSLALLSWNHAFLVLSWNILGQVSENVPYVKGSIEILILKAAARSLAKNDTPHINKDTKSRQHARKKALEACNCAFLRKDIDLRQNRRLHAPQSAISAFVGMHPRSRSPGTKNYRRFFWLHCMLIFREFRLK